MLIVFSCNSKNTTYLQTWKWIHADQWDLSVPDWFQTTWIYRDTSASVLWDARQTALHHTFSTADALPETYPTHNTFLNTNTHMNKHTHTHAYMHTLMLGFHVLFWYSIDTMVFIQYKLCIIFSTPKPNNTQTFCSFTFQTSKWCVIYKLISLWGPKNVPTRTRTLDVVIFAAILQGLPYPHTHTHYWSTEFWNHHEILFFCIKMSVCQFYFNMKGLVIHIQSIHSRKHKPHQLPLTSIIPFTYKYIRILHLRGSLQKSSWRLLVPADI